MRHANVRSSDASTDAAVGAHGAASRRSAAAKSRPKKPVRLELKQRIRSQLFHLTLDVNALQQQIEALRLHRSLLYTRALYQQQDAATGSVVRKAGKYFELFHQDSRCLDRRLAGFLRQITDDDLSLGVTGLGRETLLDQWRRYAVYFAIRKSELRSIEVVASSEDDGACVVRAEAAFYGAFTRQALELVFPSVLRDRELTRELLDRPMATDVTYHLHFNGAGRMVRHDADADFFHTLARTLGDAVRAGAIMQQAQVADESILQAAKKEEDGRGAPALAEPIERLANSKPIRVAAKTRAVGSLEDAADERKVETERTAQDARFRVDFLLS